MEVSFLVLLEGGQEMSVNPRRVVLTGVRTTGPLHLGHLVGALNQWLDVQARKEYVQYYLLADIQALSTHGKNPKILVQSVREVVLDWLSVGLDPSRPEVNFVLQSQVPERFELSNLLSVVVPYNEYMDNPTLKQEMPDDATLAFINYAHDQTADIMMVAPTPMQEGDEILVPVGRDQAPHLELARRTVRRFNRQYGNLFVPCTPLFGDIGRLVGTDGGEKMSKSKGNTIDLSDDVKTVAAKVKGMESTPPGAEKRMRITDPGIVENNPVFIYLQAFHPDKKELADLEERYRAGGIGDAAVKEILTRVLNDFLDPIRQRRAEFERTADIAEILMDGTGKARTACIPIVERARELMYLQFPSSG